VSKFVSEFMNRRTKELIVKIIQRVKKFLAELYKK
jgi:hypothetical protein